MTLFPYFLKNYIFFPTYLQTNSLEFKTDRNSSVNFAFSSFSITQKTTIYLNKDCIIQKNYNLPIVETTVFKEKPFITPVL